MFFAPRDNPEIAGVVFVEHGVHSANAAPISHHILETYLREEGRQAAAAAADARRDAARLQRSVRARQRGVAAALAAMFERRLVFHVDWLLLGAVLLLSGVGIAMIYSTTYVTLPNGGHPGPQVLDAGLRAGASASWRCWSA